MTKDEIISVYAAFVRSTLMFQLWDKHKNELREMYPGYAHGDFSADDTIIVQPSSSYLILAMATLFVVIEFLQDHFVCFPDSVRSEIEELYPKMKEFRNCVFHIQGTLLSKRQFALLEHPDLLDILPKIHRELQPLLFSMYREAGNPTDPEIPSA